MINIKRRLQNSLWIACMAFVALSLMGAKMSPVSSEAFSSEKAFSDIELNLRTGQSAPDFSLSAMQGEVVRLSSFRDSQHVLLIFYRGSWCPYCVSHFDDIQNLFPSLAQYNVQLLAISPDNDEKSRKLAKRFSQPYLFLSDPDLSVTSAYGIKSEKKYPYPSIFLINKQGDIVWYYVGKDFAVAPSGLQLKNVIKTQLGDA